MLYCEKISILPPQQQQEEKEEKKEPGENLKSSNRLVSK